MMTAPDSWHAAVNQARSASNAGDLLLLADEAPTEALRADTWMQAARVLQANGHHEFALELIKRSAAIDPGSTKAIGEWSPGDQSAEMIENRVSNRANDAAPPPGKVLLFSGHMVDGPARKKPRFPASKVAQATTRIAEVLDQLGAESTDIALTQGACGGDLLFTGLCQQRGVRTYWQQPLDEPAFIDASVLAGGADWHQRYLECRKRLDAPPRSALEALGPPPQGRGKGYAYERCNLWLLYTALAWGPEKLNLVCVWNGEIVEGPGGTGHMVEAARRRNGKIYWIDTRTL